jgi:hypothetical protein
VFRISDDFKLCNRTSLDRTPALIVETQLATPSRIKFFIPCTSKALAEISASGSQLSSNISMLFQRKAK